MIAIEQRPVSEIVGDVFEGLTKTPKSLPPRLFYDAAGSALFEEITRLPEYYLTRTESGLLQQYSAEIAERVGPNVSVIELGAGTAAKTGTIIKALSARQLRVDYYPVDISSSALQVAVESLNGSYPRVRVHPVATNYVADSGFLTSVSGRKLVLYLGSSIGNFEPEEAMDLLRRMRAHMHEGDYLLLGTDLVKDTSVLLPAYDDAQGVTARFNKNILGRINRELGGNFDLDLFRHVALWNPERSRIEMHLESTLDQTVKVKLIGLEVLFRQDERIHTENSYKYTVPGVRNTLLQAGFEIESTWTDSNNWFGTHLARAR
ncbi:MAG: L-histidine N(alpha)-methyltransferase [Terriglobales bacterium]|jgi:L-histidine Nalpha-methyltransferase